jgi:hypothetical protein
MVEEGRNYFNSMNKDYGIPLALNITIALLTSLVG